VADERARAAATAADGVRAAVATLDAAWAAGGPVTRLAGLASGTGGDNGKGLSLATYVLARRFEDVVAAANERLLAMSDGRYELARSEQKEDVSSRRTGLAMRVIDHRTQQQRDPRTLSGGESFYVSLCLALGMADVVTAEAGGIDLGTLFVDEGFGTLDAHTLDQVLAELGRLRAGGRVVGVVSHVDALKQSIADRIEVRPLADGPSTLRVLAS
jgi:exonuclease SbcC